jgi:hypothetical protein
MYTCVWVFKSVRKKGMNVCWLVLALRGAGTVYDPRHTNIQHPPPKHTHVHTYKQRTCVTVGETLPSFLSAFVSTTTYATPGRREEAIASIVWWVGVNN